MYQPVEIHIELIEIFSRQLSKKPSTVYFRYTSPTTVKRQIDEVSLSCSQKSELTELRYRTRVLSVPMATGWGTLFDRESHLEVTIFLLSMAV